MTVKSVEGLFCFLIALNEKAVIDGQTYEQNYIVIGTLLPHREVSDEDVKKLAERFADKIKKEYQDLPVNVQAVRDGEYITNITRDKCAMYFHRCMINFNRITGA